jgi:hypothetical protein
MCPEYIPAPLLDRLFLHLAVAVIFSNQPLCRPLNYIPAPLLDRLFLHLAVGDITMQ